MTTIPGGIRKAALIQTSPSGHGYRPVRSLSESKSKSKSKRFPFSMAPRPPSSTQPSLPRAVSTATIRFRYPDPRGRIPPCLLSIPRPIATPISLRHLPCGRQLSPGTQRPRLHKDSRAQVQRLRRWGGRIRFRQLQTELHQKSRIRRQLPPSRRRPGR